MLRRMTVALARNSLGHAPGWYKVAMLGFLSANPVMLWGLAPFITGWVLVLEFIFTLAMALRCYPLQPGGLLALEAKPSRTRARGVRTARTTRRVSDGSGGRPAYPPDVPMTDAHDEAHRPPVVQGGAARRPPSSPTKAWKVTTPKDFNLALQRRAAARYGRAFLARAQVGEVGVRSASDKGNPAEHDAGAACATRGADPRWEAATRQGRR
jgi:Na+/H+ antiporter B (NhaB)